MSTDGPTKKQGKSTSSTGTKGGITGGVAGAAKNAAQYIIKQGGTRWYNGVNIFDKTVRNAKGFPKWFARVDYATPKNPIPHINVNRAVTGLRDPHIQISSAAAQNAAKAGTALNYLNKAAPVLTVVAVAYDGYQIGKNVKVDRENGSTRNTTKKVVTTAATWGAGYGGAFGGAAMGTAIFPGIGTLIGGIVGGIAGGIGGSLGSELAADAAMDALKYDIIFPECKMCHATFECRKFETGTQLFCGDCIESMSKVDNSLSEKKTCQDCGNIIENGVCDTCKRCGWCGTLKEALEEIRLEEGTVELCEVCIAVLKKEIEGILSSGSEGATLEAQEATGREENLDEAWICKSCKTPIEGQAAPEDEEDLTILCAICRENLANEILLKNEKVFKSIAYALNKLLRVESCKWCDEDFIVEVADQKKIKDFCPDCEEKRPKKKGT